MFEQYSDENPELDGANGGDFSTGAHIQSPRGLQGGLADPSRHGKERRTDPYSDEEGGAGGGGRDDVFMEDSPNSPSFTQRQDGGVRFYLHC